MSPCPCSLVFRCDNANLATLLLAARILTAHGATDSEFVLQYGGNTLAPNHVKLSTGKACVQGPQLDKLSPAQGKAKKRLDIKTLELSTKETSPLWCPASTPTFSPKPRCEALFQHLVDLAKATVIHAVFDFNQLDQALPQLVQSLCQGC